MAFDEKLAERVRGQVGGRDGLSEKKMFGGLAFLLHGNMSCGIHGDELIVRIDPETTEAALAEPGTRIFDITGRPMKGWLLVGAAGLEDEPTLVKWVRRGLDYAASLPKK
jgi:TfoX/Sxy family transcriptional regulator of competence genes